MNTKIFLAIFLTSALFLGFANAFMLFVLESSLKKQTFQELENQAHNIEPFLESVLKNKLTIPPYRLSVINQDGAVVYDTEFAPNFVALENHKSREEIAQALESGEGRSVRYSQSSKSDMLYFAKRVSLKDADYILRLALAKSNIYALIAEFAPYFGIEILGALVLCFFIARILTRAIIKPLKNFNVANTKQKAPYKELRPFIEMIKSQHKLLKNQLKGLKQKQIQMLTLTQNMNEGLMLLNKNGKVLLTNSALQGYLGDIASDINKMQETPAMQQILRDMADFKKSKKPTQRTHTLSLQNKECEILIVPIYAKNKFKGLIAFVRDMSLQAQAQALRREFSANVTHELKTPLSVILASSEMMQNNLIAQADFPQFVEKIQKEATKLLAMINEILKLSFLDERQAELQKTRINLATIAENVLKRLEIVAEKKNINLRAKLKECFVMGNSALLEDMIYNLCENAIKYNRKKGVVSVRVEQKDALVRVRVKDTGCGIPKESFERIFERFYCVDTSRSKQLGGNGLGLSIVKSIARFHNASIELSSTLGKGSEFVVTFQAA
ncbi:two-component sensor histidine kinase [Helicobacter sp. MIT 00-7814]|uniref:sensor histidine kinase n=1 Tax=unclassified Helicobacter TaxID=2593540 RepID=UPI000E1E350E|nr:MULTISPECIES: HAMP domain-containing sensor histidine kinase [unclassified Helicobacter]RDU52455.1 two-component sensor histidine kinase [Helicobacter sp. MIT 00-7814]RDU53165.1 two-component sensor histidine kinase [Helicobacter sp. MIT 99-10781]